MGQLGEFVVHHWVLWLALIVILILIFLNEKIAQKKQGKALSPNAVVDLINQENATVFDLRDEHAYKAGHIVDALRVTKDEFNKPRFEKYKDKPMVLVCPRGLQSQSLAATLKKQGFTDVNILAGGISAWQAATLPLVKSKNKKES